jgi:hypothetical protein
MGGSTVDGSGHRAGTDDSGHRSQGSDVSGRGGRSRFISVEPGEAGLDHTQRIIAEVCGRLLRAGCVRMTHDRGLADGTSASKVPHQRTLPGHPGSQWLCWEDHTGEGKSMIFELYIALAHNRPGGSDTCAACDVYALVKDGSETGLYCDHPNCLFRRPTHWADLEAIGTLDDVCNSLQVQSILHDFTLSETLSIFWSNESLSRGGDLGSAGGSGPIIIPFDLCDLCSRLSNDFPSPCEGVRHRLKKVMVRVPLVVNMQHDDLHGYLYDMANSFGFATVRAHGHPRSNWAMTFAVVTRAYNAAIGGPPTNLRTVDRIKEGGMSACLLVMPMDSEGDQDWMAQHETSNNALSPPTIHQGQARSGVFYHTFPGYLICIANKDHDELPEGAEEIVMDEVNTAMQKLTFDAARTWLWSRIVNPAESFISSEISQLLSMLDPLQLSSVDPRLNDIWRCKLQLQSLQRMPYSLNPTPSMAPPCNINPNLYLQISNPNPEQP